ncbi:MAG: beta-N-acetylhexosaminidase [Saprospiraceae bacterium]|nr:beta-N-acetylhexosaminidase [Saprospiraceae bacterium]
MKALLSKIGILTLTYSRNGIYEGIKSAKRSVASSLGLALLAFHTYAFATDLSNLGLYVIPYPQEVILGGDEFKFASVVPIYMDQKSSEADLFAALELVNDLKKQFGIDAEIVKSKLTGSIVLSREPTFAELGDQGYRLETSGSDVIIQAAGEAGLFYGTQTLLQLIKAGKTGYIIPGMQIRDWPHISERAAHYDTKHHQDKKAYVESFIKDLARFKINILVWEWEDKLAYPSHPEIGAPGAFTIEEIQYLTHYASKYHIEMVPLVQGLGHVSFILKWAQYQNLREVDASNWEFCPYKEGTYELLFDLWEDAIKATPGSRYIHIGSDETYELAACDVCKSKAADIGRSGVYHTFVSRAAQHLKSMGREVMVWETPMGWEHGRSPIKNIRPEEGLVLSESYEYEEADFKYAKKAKELGFKVYAYDPNPGIEQAFLPYFYKERGNNIAPGSLQDSYEYLSSTALSGAFDGMINTSWDDEGLHNQQWMLSFVTSAAFSWNGKNPPLNEFTETFFRNYYGTSAIDMQELFQLLNEGAYYFQSTFERKIWHHGDIGKTHLPDLPRGDALEYDPFWTREYGEILQRSSLIEGKMKRALSIISSNLELGIKNSYDLEIFRTIANLIRHTALVYDDLEKLEKSITAAHRSHFESHDVAYQHLQEANDLITFSLNRRKAVFEDLVSTWEKTRLPKGMSTANKKYFFEQDRARHFANRTADMTYWIYDEQLLGLEKYQQQLQDYQDYYRKRYLKP